MNVIELARELGKALQEDGRYKAFEVAKKKNDSDTELQATIEKFNELRRDLNVEMGKEEKDGDKMTALDTEIKEVYSKIMGNESMIEYNSTRESMDKLLSSVNFIITMAANGEDPMTCPEEQPQSCSGSCSSCNGCN